MALVSMKNTPADIKEEQAELTTNPEVPAYPWGLCVDLCDESLQKLGMTDLPPVGTKMKLTALVEVTTVSQYQNSDGAESRLSLQITDMQLDPAEQSQRSDAQIASALYN